MKKIFCFLTVFLLIFVSCCVSVFAFSTSTYADLVQSSTQANNLLSIAENYDSFDNSDFVICQIAQYEYRIFWGDLSYNGSSVSGSKVEYIQYVREGSGYDYQYHYRYGTDETLTLSVNHLTVSNIDSLGTRSALYEQYEFYDITVLFLIFLLAVLIASLFLLFRSVYK